MKDNNPATASEFLQTQYYLILKLPFNLLLLYREGFSHLSDAEQHLSNHLPSFSVCDKEELTSWDGKVVLVPVKKPKSKGSFSIIVQANIAVDSDSPDRAHRKIHNRLRDLGFSNIRTKIDRSRIAVRSEDVGAKQA